MDKSSKLAQEEITLPPGNQIAEKTELDAETLKPLADRPNPKAKQVKGLPKYFWRWLAGSFAVILLGFGLFTYIRVTSFVDNSFNGRNETSLLTITPRVVVTKPPVPTQVQNTVTLPPLTTTNIQSTQPIATPTPLPMPTATPTIPANLPLIIQKIKRGEPLTLLAVGYGGGQHDGAFLTDTIMVMTYDPTKNAVTMVNIPRDLYVFVPYGGAKTGFWGKINSAFAYVMNSPNSSNLSPRYRFSDQKSQLDAAVNLLKDVVEPIVGVPVDYWATFSFDGFRKFIDAIGGVEVEVDTTFDDYEYPANDDPNIDPSVIHLHFEAGLQKMNGDRAIQYSRSRHAAQDGNDFSRSKRQMKVVAAVKEKVAKPDVMLKAFGLMDALQGNLRVSLSPGEAKALLDYFQGEGAADIKKLLFVPQVLSTNNYLDDGATDDGAYILFPAAGRSNYSAIQTWLERGRDFPELRAENLRVQLQNGTGQSDIMTRLTSQLTQNGLDNVTSIWANPMEKTVIYDYSGGKATNTLKALVGALPGVTVQVGKKSTNQTDDIVVVLGRDQTPSAVSNPPRQYNQPSEPEFTPRSTRSK